MSFGGKESRYRPGTWYLFMKLTCTEFEILLADAVDGTLSSADRFRFDAHFAECTECAALARDSMGAVALIGMVEVVEPPLALVNKILFEATRGLSHVETKPSWISRWFGPVAQPRFAMGMAMTLLSVMMLGRYTGVSFRQLKPSDLNPVNAWAITESRAHRIWDRAVKSYENLRLVYDLESQLSEWNRSAATESDREENR